MARRHEHGRHAATHGSIGAEGLTYQLDAIVEAVGQRDVHRLDLVDAFDLHLAEIRLRAERDGSKNQHLVRSISARHVEERIAFGIAKPLRLRQHRLVSRARAQHFREDVVARPVEDA